jgi:GDPmannose 4,6-dehydratase
MQDKLFLGNLDAVRDWGYAPEYVVAMWKMLQLTEAKDFVVATGQSISVGQFLTQVFDEAGLSVDEHVEIDERYLRPTEVDSLVGDSSLANSNLDWTPKTSALELARIMLRADIDFLSGMRTIDSYDWEAADR